jgi:hypothetical protein
MQQRSSCPGAAAGRSGAAAMQHSRPLATRSRPLTAVCRAQNGRSPRSTVSEASDKARQQQLKRPSALAEARQPRPASPDAQQHDEDAAQQQQQQQQQQQSSKGQGQAWWRERRREAQRAAGMTRWEEVMRDTPGLNRLVDGTLILGDAVMVLATEVRGASCFAFRRHICCARLTI